MPAARGLRVPGHGLPASRNGASAAGDRAVCSGRHWSGASGRSHRTWTGRSSTSSWPTLIGRSWIGSTSCSPRSSRSRWLWPRCGGRGGSSRTRWWATAWERSRPRTWPARCRLPDAARVIALRSRLLRQDRRTGGHGRGRAVARRRPPGARRSRRPIVRGGVEQRAVHRHLRRRRRPRRSARRSRASRRVLPPREGGRRVPQPSGRCAPRRPAGRARGHRAALGRRRVLLHGDRRRSRAARASGPSTGCATCASPCCSRRRWDDSRRTGSTPSWR